MFVGDREHACCIWKLPNRS